MRIVVSVGGIMELIDGVSEIDCGGCPGVGPEELGWDVVMVAGMRRDNVLFDRTGGVPVSTDRD